MYKAGDKVIFKKYEYMPDWKFGVFEIGEIKLDNDLIFKYSLVKKKLVFGKMIDVYTSTWYTKSEIINIKEDRKLKLKKINESR